MTAAGDLDYVRTLVRQRAAIVVDQRKDYLLETRLAPLVRSEGLGSMAELVGRLRAQPHGPLSSQVVDAMTTNETSFFRDVHPFTTLEKEILPELITRRAAQQAITFWCAACSSGQEPYSIAMLLLERFPQLRTWNVRIIATDISAEMLGRAASGTYTQFEINRGLPAALLVKYFTRSGTSWQVKDELRQMMEFRALNLAQTWPFIPQVDLLFMRNVLIYFDQPTKRVILDRAAAVLRRDGTLFLGGAETTLGVNDRFERMKLERTNCYRLR